MTSFRTARSEEGSSPKHTWKLFLHTPSFTACWPRLGFSANTDVYQFTTPGPSCQQW